MLVNDAAAGVLYAHGLGGRGDLPPDAGMAAIGAAIAVAGSFVIVLFARTHSEGRVAESGRPMTRLSRALGAPAVLAVVRGVVLVAAVLVIAVALFGPQESRFNLAPYTLYAVFWVGLAFTSMVFGPIWRLVNPLRTVHSAICRLARHDRDEGVRPLPASVGIWPAAGALLIFVWLELVYPQRAEPYVVGLFLTTYSVVHIVLALLYGRRWFDAGDGFEVYSRLLGAVSPLGRREDGTLVLRSPLQNLAALHSVPGTVATLAVLIGSTGFDGLTRTSFWQQSVPPTSVPLGTAGLLALVAIVAIVYTAAVRLGARLATPQDPLARAAPARSRRAEPAYAGAAATRGRTRSGAAATARVARQHNAVQRPKLADMPGAFAHSLVPIALGYTFAHYFSFFLFEAQTALSLISDPFGRGWDLFGTAERSVNYQFISTTAIARVQVYAIVIGHIVGVIAAHDRALSLFGPQLGRRSQYPLAAVMITMTMCGILLLLSA